MQDIYLVYSAVVIGLFISVYFCIKYYIKLSLIHKVVAYPTDRSIHKEKTPTSGGIIFGSFHLLSLLITLFFVTEETRGLFIKLCIGGLFILILGLIDDIKNIRPRYKLLGQVIVAVVMFLLGVKISRITNPFGSAIFIGHFSILVTIIWYLLVMNAVNLIDGLDGLAAGIAVKTCIVLLIFAFHHDDPFIILSCLYLVISLLPFLRFNFPIAKLFMGDSGSLYIGYFLATISIAGSETQIKGLTTFTILVPITVLFMPILDTFFTVVRRWKNGQPIFKADKKHLHHNLLDTGLSKTTVTLILWLITIIFGVLALGYIYLSKLIMIVILLFFGSIMLCLFFYIYKKELLR